MISNKRLFKYFKTITLFLVVSVIISCIVISLNNPKGFFYSTFYDQVDLNELFEMENSLLTENKCSPFLNDTKQFSILIDGVKYPQRIALYENKSINFECLNSLKKPKVILMWNKFKGKPHMDYPFGVRKPFQILNCPVTSCELTNDRSKFKESNLVLFHLRNHIDTIPERVHPLQRFVHVIFESPVHCHLCNKYENVFNFTAGYHTQADYMSQYWTDSGLYWDLNENFNTSKDFSLGKNLFAATLISNCNARIRTDYINEFKKYANVTIYGKCGSNVNDLCGSKSKTKIDCREYLSERYKFYFAFENTICDNGYITEKFFDSLNYNILVVAFGGGDYTKYIPENGFIDARDFKTPLSLAKYLKYLDKNKTAYNEYFKWKKYIKVLRKNDNLMRLRDEVIPYQMDKIVLAGFLCEMCIQLNLERLTSEIKTKRINSLTKMYSMNENCYSTTPGQFKLIKGHSSLKYSGFMSPEKKR
jgi:alpha-1,3-fucosyltransferase